jgi:hypothetical protein
MNLIIAVVCYDLNTKFFNIIDLICMHLMNIETNDNSLHLKLYTF